MSDPTIRTLEQFRCRNGKCREDVLPVRISIEHGEIQVRCRRCKTITWVRYRENVAIYATVIAGNLRREEDFGLRG